MSARSPRSHHHHHHPNDYYNHHHSHFSIPEDYLVYFQNKNLVFNTCALLLATIPVSFTWVLPSFLPSFIERTLIAFASGSLLGDLFLHSLPSLHSNDWPFLFIGFVFFYLLQRILFLFTGHDCHSHSHSHTTPTTNTTTTSKVKPAATTNTTTSKQTKSLNSRSSMNSSIFLQLCITMIHTFLNGFLLSMAFQPHTHPHSHPHLQEKEKVKESIMSGLSGFLALFLHEVPHRFSDFMLLQTLGASRSLAKQCQLLMAFSTFCGAYSQVMFPNIAHFHTFLLPLAQGGFMYMVTTMMLPILIQTPSKGIVKKIISFVVEFIAMMAGVYVMAQF